MVSNMNNDRGLLSGSITILIGAVIAIMALVRGPWQVWLLLGVFTLWGLWVVLILDGFSNYCTVPVQLPVQ